ncbi:MAG: S8 family serine peptidase, partial [Armatimonadota bacterium]|nr:S8 family serine peptidase [Armatimonadota bacterium]
MRGWSVRLGIAGAALLLVACGSGAIRSVPVPAPEVVSGEILVRYRSDSALVALAAVRGATVVRTGRFRLPTGTEHIAVIRVPPGEEATYIDRFRRNPEVVYAGYNYRVRRVDGRTESFPPRGPRVPGSGVLDWTGLADPKLVECDPAFEVQRLNGERTRCTEADRSASWQWNLWRIQAPQAWRLADGEGVVVAVVDEGVDLTHPEFAARVVLPREGCPTDVVDEDFDPGDSGGHGTHVAGIVAAAPDGRGIVGVAPRARILPIRALGPLGGTTFTVVSGILCAVEHGAAVLNGSWGGVAYSEAELDALRAAVASGVFVVLAAGNLHDAGNPRVYPAAFAEVVPGVVAVGATTPTDRIASFSSSGRWVTLAAPGTTIYSTLPTVQGSYGFLQGTSMAAPHVAGVAALLLSRNPRLPPARVQSLLQAAAFAPCPEYPRPDWDRPGSCG